MAVVPNWPRLETSVCWAAGPSQSNVQMLWTDVTSRTVGKANVRRGKQYELDQVQPGEMGLTLRNDDGAFDPSNTSSPYTGYVVPYRLIRLRAQYPYTVNLLTAEQATALYATKGAYATSTPPTNTTITSGILSIAYAVAQQTNRYNVNVAVSTTATLAFGGFSIAPGLSYTGSCSASGTNVTARLAIQWYTAAGSLISTSNGTATALTGSTSAMTVTGTAPSNAAGAKLVWTNTSATAGTFTAWNLQIEQASSASAFATPGTWYSLFNGYVERWPQAWGAAGIRGLSELTCIDRFTFLANRGMRNVFEADVLALDPNFLYRLDEEDGATEFADASGKRPNAALFSQSTPYLQAGQGIDSADNSPPAPGGSPTGAITGAFLGSPGPAVHITGGDAKAIRRAGNGGAIVIPPDPTTGTYGPPVAAPFFRVIAARAEPGAAIPVDGAYAWSFNQVAPNVNTANGVWIGTSPYLLDPGHVNTPESFVAVVTYVGNPTAQVIQVSGIDAGASFWTGLNNDGDWHLYGVGYDPGTLHSFSSFDYELFDIDYSFQPSAMPSSTNRTRGDIWLDTIGMFVNGQTKENLNWLGDVAYAFELDFIPTAAQWKTLYMSWRNAWAYESDSAYPDFPEAIHDTETSGVRYQRILDWLSYTGTSSIDSGAQVQYGPATDIQGGSQPTDALTALQNVVDTECGQHFVSGDGTITFQSRLDRVNRSPIIGFGEHATSAGPVAQTNYCLNPNFEANVTTGWLATASASIAIDGTTSFAGTKSLKVTVNSGAVAVNGAFIGAQNVTPGTAWWARSRYKIATTLSVPYYLALIWRDATNATISTSYSTTTIQTGTSGAWGEVTVSGVAPSNAVTMVMAFINQATSSALDVFNLDNVIETITLDGNAPIYFDGSTTASATQLYAWTGTTNLSTSTMSLVEVPYTDAKIDYDPTRIANDVTVTSQFGGTNYRHADSASNDLFGTVTLSRTANSMDPYDLDTQSQFLLYQYKTPTARVEELPIDVGARPAVGWAALLPLELGSCAQVTRRPPGAPSMSITGFIEQITWEIADDLSVDWKVEISNNTRWNFFELNDSTYGVLDSAVAILGY